MKDKEKYKRIKKRELSLYNLLLIRDIGEYIVENNRNIFKEISNESKLFIGYFMYKEFIKSEI